MYMHFVARKNCQWGFRLNMTHTKTIYMYEILDLEAICCGTFAFVVCVGLWTVFLTCLFGLKIMSFENR